MFARYGVAALFFLLVLAGPNPPARAQNVVKLGEYQSWTAYAAGKDAGRICYIVGQANGADAPGHAPRYAYVAHRPAKKAWSVVMIFAGAPYKEASGATVEIGRSEFSLFTYRDTAWTPDADTDARLVRSMRVGKTMVVRSVDASGAAIVDQYPLNGFLAAYRRIGEACNLK
jgi:hypothetical protein